MSDNNEDLEKLRKKNIELTQALKVSSKLAEQKERENLNLVRERNELKLKLHRIRSGSAAQIRQLDAALQAAIQETLTHLVQASDAVARTMELAKTYMRDRQELDASSPRWSRLSDTPAGTEKERVNRVPPLLIGGQSIQPVVSLSRTLLDNNNSPSANRSPNQQNNNVTERAVPMHVLQDLYIRLTRIDAPELTGNQEEDEANNMDNSAEDLGLEAEQELEESQNDDDFRNPLETIIEVDEPEEGDQTSAGNENAINPLEGPSWLLDVHNDTESGAPSRGPLEPDSTTCLQDAETSPSDVNNQASAVSPEVGDAGGAGVATGAAFTPTMRRRKRTSSPLQPPLRRNSINKRVLKVVVAKMKFEDEDTDPSPPKKMKHSSPRPSPILQSLHQKLAQEHAEDKSSPILQMKIRPKAVIESAKDMTRFDAPSPNGATDARVIIVSEPSTIACGSSEQTRHRHNALVSHSPRDTENEIPTQAHVTRRDTSRGRKDTHREMSASTRERSLSQRDTSQSRRDTEETRRDNSRSVTPESDLDRQEGRSRRTRKQVVYKEKPLNRKLRR